MIRSVKFWWMIGPRRFSVVTAAVLLLSACQTSLPVMTADTSAGPISYMMSIRQNTSTGLDRLMTPLKTTTRDGLGPAAVVACL